VVRFARQVGPDVHTLSAGGGLPVQYREDDPPIDVEAYYRIWDGERKALAHEFGHPVQLEIEPGRFLTAESGYLICEIRAVKRMGKNLFYVLDAGFNNLARPILYGAYHPMSIAPGGASGSDRHLQDVVVGGPLCESGDIFTQDEGGIVRAQRLPEASVGEHLVIECAGAYGFVMGSNYNSRTLAAEVLIAKGEPHLVRKRQRAEDLFRDESIPTLE
jgi:diaminopimelate decarboxylase